MTKHTLQSGNKKGEFDYKNLKLLTLRDYINLQRPVNLSLGVDKSVIYKLY